MPLTGFKSICTKNQQVIPSRDKGNQQVHIAYNPNRYDVSHYQIDGVVITTGNRCDFLLLKEAGEKVAYFIELKGSDLAKAALQLDSTANALAQELKEYSFLYRIVANKCKTQEVESCDFKKYKIKWGKRLAYTTRKMEENL